MQLVVLELSLCDRTIFHKSADLLSKSLSPFSSFLALLCKFDPDEAYLYVDLLDFGHADGSENALFLWESSICTLGARVMGYWEVPNV